MYIKEKRIEIKEKRFWKKNKTVPEIKRGE